MLAKLLATAGAAALLIAGAPAAADTPTVAVVGVNTGAQPQNLDVLDRSATWVPIGALNSTTHTWAPLLTAPGSNGQLQFNNSGAFGAATALSWNPTTSTLTLPDASTWASTGLSVLKVAGGGQFGATVQSALASGVAFSINAGVFGQLGIDPASGRGESPCLGYSTSSATTLGTCVLDWTPGGTAGSTVNVYGNLNIKDADGVTIFSQYSPGTGDSVNIASDAASLDIGASGAVGFCHDGGVSSTPVLDVDNGACGNAGGSLKAALLSAPTLTATTTINLPDTGSITSNGITTGGNTNSGGLVVLANSPTALPAWTPTVHGAGRIGNSSAGIAIGSSGSTTLYGYPGFVVQGVGGEGDSGCSIFCAVNDLSLMDKNGNVIAGVQHPVAAFPFPFTIGLQKLVPALTEADEGSPGLVQLLLSDVISTGTEDAPYVLWQPGDSQLGGPAFVALGPESPTNHNIRLGTANNEVSPWSDNFDVDADIEGCWGVGIPNGSSGPWSGGVGVTWVGKVCPLSTGGVEFMNGLKSADAPLKALYAQTTFDRIAPTTVSDLASVDISPTDGDSAYVTDAASCTLNGPLAGSGSTHCRVHYDGSSSSWKGG